MTIREWLGQRNELGEKILSSKYMQEGETLDQFFDRVSGGDEEARNLIMQRKLLLGGRTFANRGIVNSASFFNCFIAGTRVITKRGLINIEDVVVGDEVISEDNDWHVVNDVMQREYSGDLYRIKSNYFPEDIVCTPNHRFLTQHGWKRADRIEVHHAHSDRQDMLKVSALAEEYYSDASGSIGFKDLRENYAPIREISVEEDAHTVVYNLSVEDVHSYTANGVVVHNCYSHGFVADDYKDIMKTAMNIGLTFKAQGGQGLSLSKLRPKGSPIGKEYSSDGIIPFMKIYNEVTAGTSQGGSRKGALMISLDARHKEAPAFISVKAQNGSIEKANLSLEIDDEFMQAVEHYYNTGEVTILHEKRSYAGHVVEYDVNPVEVFNQLVENCYDWGDPAALFVNKFRNYNIMELDSEYNIETSNPCGIR